MKLNQFKRKISRHFTPKERIFIKYNIQYNNKQYEYQRNYKSSNYNICYEIICKNKQLLNLTNTPINWRISVIKELKVLEGRITTTQVGLNILEN